MKPEKTKPAPLETDRGEQNDDNIDEFGNRPDGSEQDQPVNPDQGSNGHAGDGDKPGSPDK